MTSENAEREMFADRVKREIHEGINPLYVENLLNKSLTDLLLWYYQHTEDHLPTIAETISLSQDPNKRGILRFGVVLLQHDNALMRFIANEISDRVNAIEPEDES